MKKLTFIIIKMALAFLLSFGADTARATIIFDAMTPGYWMGGCCYSVKNDAYVAQAFTTDASNYTIDNILWRTDGAPYYATATVTIYRSSANSAKNAYTAYDAAAGTPDFTSAAIGVLSNPTANSEILTFSGNSIALSANTTYWAVMANVDPNYYGTMSYYTSLNFVSQPGSIYILSAQAATGPPGTLLYWGITGNAMTMQVNASAAVPEPSTYVLAGVGLAALYWLRRRRNGAAQVGIDAGVVPE